MLVLLIIGVIWLFSGYCAMGLIAKEGERILPWTIYDKLIGVLSLVSGPAALLSVSFMLFIVLGRQVRNPLWLWPIYSN